MSSIFGSKLKISIFGQSHSGTIGVDIYGFPAGFSIDFDALNRFMKRRAPGNSAFATQRKEADIPEFISGVVDGLTTGEPIRAIIRNTNVHSSDYDNLLDCPRPSHADYTAKVKFGDSYDMRGGGKFSGRMTAPFCIAGGLCLQYLETKGIFIQAHISSIADIFDTPYLETQIDSIISDDKFPVFDESKKEKMLAKISEAKSNLDSVGGTVECAVLGFPAGVGDAMFDGLESKISAAIFGIPAVKGIEFGSGFAGSTLLGSQNNDPFYYDDGTVRTKTNNHGGILGGISTGMPIVFKVAFKPTPSIGKAQETVNLKTKTNETIVIKGRHDPCIVPRAVPCVEAACAVALCDYII